MKLIHTAATAAVLISTGIPSQGAEQQDQDLMMILQNASGSFVTHDFALRLGQLVMSQKYQGAVLAPGPPEVLDKADSWSVTFTIERWTDPLVDDRVAPRQLTIRIRKKDAAIVSIK